MFEQLVRPFQLREAVRDKERVVTSVTKQPTQKAVLVWGAVGKQPKPYSTGLSFKVIDELNYKETSRKTTDVRVENPDDSTQFVVEQRIDKISFKKKAKDDATTTTSTNLSGASGGATTTTATKATADTTVSDVTTETTKTPATTDDEKHTYELDQPLT